MNGYGFMDLLQSLVIKRFDVSNRILDQSTDAHTHTQNNHSESNWWLKKKHHQEWIEIQNEKMPIICLENKTKKKNSIK